MAAHTARVVSFPQGARVATASETEAGAGAELAGAATGEFLSMERPQEAVRFRPAPRLSRIVAVQNLGGERLRLTRPLYVLLEESDGFVVATSYDLELAEQGDSEFKALEQFRGAVVELYDELCEMDADAPGHLRQKLAFLKSLTR